MLSVRAVVVGVLIRNESPTTTTTDKSYAMISAAVASTPRCIIAKQHLFANFSALPQTKQRFFLFLKFLQGLTCCSCKINVLRCISGNRGRNFSRIQLFTMRIFSLDWCNDLYYKSTLLALGNMVMSITLLKTFFNVLDIFVFWRQWTIVGRQLWGSLMKLFKMLVPSLFVVKFYCFTF